MLPLRLFVVADKIGGQVLGAFDGREMIAFSLCLPGLKPGGQLYLHSNMLGVLAPYRNTGVGRAMKWKQREYALASGLDLIEWTFDPLELKNAFFNIERLGAIARRYVHNQYGTSSSPLHGGLPTDRLIAEWWIRSPRVEALAQNQPLPRADTQSSIEVPADISSLRKHDPHQAREIQACLADRFESAFRAGLAVTGFEKSATSGTYLLSSPEHSWPSN